MKYIFNNKEYEVRNVYNRMDQKQKTIETLEKLNDNLIYEDSKMTVYTKTNGIELSEGCRACKNGSWWCLFVGHECNASCKFCPQEKTKEYIDMCTHPRTISKYWIDDVKFYLDKLGEKLTGISYSGGEPLMYLDKIEEIAKYVKTTRPNIYQWIYTNGKLITKDVLQKLKECDIKEIRVDLAATNFDDKIVEKLKMCKEIIGKVTIEVPAIMETFKKLVSEKYLDKIVEFGVEQLNLAEVQIVQQINFENYAAFEDIYVYDSLNGEEIYPCYSRKLTHLIMEYAINNELNILINDCSADAKHVQRLMRMKNLPDSIW